MPLAPGTRLGPYDISAPLGHGGMGEVYRAKDTRLDRDVAIKILPEAFVTDRARVARFEREAKVLAGLNHPNIATVHGVEDSDSGLVLVMELVEGPTLADRLTGGPIPTRQALTIAKQLADALAAAHERGIVHRDLKPANIKLRPDGFVKVLDFGLAKAMDRFGDAEIGNATTRSALTKDGVVLGTAPYMSPEQAKGLAVDQRTDLWAFGAILFEMLAGRRAFPGADVPETLTRVLRDDPDWNALPPKTSPAIRRLIRRSLERDVARRLSSAADVALELVDALSVPEKSSGARSGRVVLWASLAGVVIVSGAVFFVQWRRAADASPPASQSGLVSIAVLPFDNRADKDEDAFTDGLTDELISSLAHVRSLRVVDRMSVFALKGKTSDVHSIGRQLSAQTVLEGSVYRAGGTTRVTAELVNASNGYQIWAQSYDRSAHDVFAVQSDIAEQVVAQLKLALLPSEQAMAVSQHRSSNPDAYNEFLIGRQFLRTAVEDGSRSAAAAFERAIALDPDYAAAYGQLSSALIAASTRSTEERIPLQQRGVWAANQAVALAPGLAEAYAARGSARTYVSWDWDGAKADFERALALDPNNPETYAQYSRLFARLGRLPEAIEYARRAAEMDPLDPGAKYLLGQDLCAAGETAEARRVLSRAVEISPSNLAGRFLLNETLLIQGKPDEALAKVSDRSALLDGTIAALALDDLGRHSESERVLQPLIAKFGQKSAPGAYYIALIYAGRKDLDAAFGWLDRAYDQKDGRLGYLKSEPLAANLRGDPRFSAMLKKLNLPLQ